MNVYEKIESLGIKLPTPPAKGGLYNPAKEFGSNFIYISGCGPDIDGKEITGKLGVDLTVEEGQEAAKNCMLNALAVLQNKIGDLNKVKSFVKVLTLVAGSSEFYSQPAVANGGTKLLIDIFGEDVGCPARSAIGVNALPGNISVETELLVELK